MAPSLVSFRRHLCTHHGEQLTVSHSGGGISETFSRLPPDELRRRRAMLACRQGGRRATRRYREQRFAEERRRSYGPTADRRPPQVSDAVEQPSGYRRTVNYIPAGYRSDSPASVSSLSDGENDSEHTDYNDDPATGYVRYVHGWNDMPELARVETAVDMETAGPSAFGVANSSGRRVEGPPVPEPYLPPPPPSATPPLLAEMREAVAPPVPPAREDGGLAEAVPIPPPVDVADPPAVFMAVPMAVPEAVFTDPPAVSSPPIASSATAQPSSVEDDTVESAPLPELEPPDLSTRQLAAMVGSVMANHRLAGVDVIQDAVQRMIRRATTPQRRTINLAVDFGCELMREVAGLILRDISETFGDMPQIPHEALATFLCDAIHKWNTRPFVPRFRAEPEIINISESDSSQDSASSADEAAGAAAADDGIHFDTDSEA